MTILAGGLTRTMSDKSIISGTRFLDLVYEEVSKVLQAVDAFFEESSYIPLWGSACHFLASKAVNQPSAWAPKTFTRTYVSKSERETYTRFAYFNVYLAPPGM